MRHIYWWLEFLRSLAHPGNIIRDQPLTLVVTAADLRPWTGLARQFAVIKEGRLNVLGDRSQLENANAELVGELLTTGPRTD